MQTGKKIAGRLLELVSLYGNGKHTVFAKKAGIPHGTFSAYIKGRVPHAEHLCRIHDTYNININWLLTGEGEMILDPEKEGVVAENTPIYNKEEKPAEDAADHILKNKLIQTQDKLISQMELIDQLKNRLAETEEKLKASEERAGRLREDNPEAHRGDILKKKAM